MYKEMHKKMFFSKDMFLKNKTINLLKKYWNGGFKLTKDFWDATKRETKETQDAIRILGNILSKKTVTDDEKQFLKNQSVDIIKIIPLIAIKGIPSPIPISLLLIFIGKKIGFDILPNSHKKTKHK